MPPPPPSASTSAAASPGTDVVFLDVISSLKLTPSQTRVLREAIASNDPAITVREDGGRREVVNLMGRECLWSSP